MIKNKITVSKKLGDNLRFERELRSISIERAAKIANMTAESLKRYEAGESGISTLEITKLADAYCVPVPKLFAGCNIDA